MANLGAVLIGLGRPAEAVPVFQELFDARTAVLEPGAPGILNAGNGLVAALAQAGRSDEAEARLVPLIEEATRALGPAADQTLSLRNTLGYLLLNHKRLSEAAPILTAALADAEAKGDAERDTLGALAHNLAEVELRLGRIDDARRHAQQALELRSRLADPALARKSRALLESLETDPARGTPR